VTLAKAFPTNNSTMSNTAIRSFGIRLSSYITVANSGSVNIKRERATRFIPTVGDEMNNIPTTNHKLPNGKNQLASERVRRLCRQLRRYIKNTKVRIAAIIK
jgi:hypothetical protein